MADVLYYCSYCKKFRPHKITGKCKWCNSPLKPEFKDSNDYYNAHYKDPDFKEQERNYESICKEKTLRNSTPAQTSFDENNVTVSDSIPGKIIVKNLGMVSGTDNYTAGLIGEGYGHTTTSYAIKRATSNMIKQAVSKGANAIVSCKTTTSAGTWGAVVLTITGSAVVVKDQVDSVSTRGFSATDEIIKFKQLLDMGIITQDEFNAKKKELLGL